MSAFVYITYLIGSLLNNVRLYKQEIDRMKDVNFQNVIIWTTMWQYDVLGVAISAIRNCST